MHSIHHLRNYCYLGSLCEQTESSTTYLPCLKEFIVLSHIKFAHHHTLLNVQWIAFKWLVNLQKLHFIHHPRSYWCLGRLYGQKKFNVARLRTLNLKLSNKHWVATISKRVNCCITHWICSSSCFIHCISNYFQLVIELAQVALYSSPTSYRCLIFNSQSSRTKQVCKCKRK